MLKDFNKETKDILENKVFQEMDGFIQHGDTTCMEHCLSVAKTSYSLGLILNKRFHLGLDVRAIARGALLHDLFLYDWHGNKFHVGKLFHLTKMHGFTHPQIALDNAKKYFKLNNIEKDIIQKHMWPLTLLHIPRYKESLIVCMVDKYCSIKELKLFKKKTIITKKKKFIFS
jgi:uncharacterized protein